jgi:prevent-host-death family protein
MSLLRQNKDLEMFMKDIRLNQDMVPIAKFKSQAKQWLKKIAETGQTLVITQNGVPAGVLISPQEFDQYREQLRFLEGLAAGIQDSEAGRVVSTKALRARIAKRRKQ